MSLFGRFRRPPPPTPRAEPPPVRGTIDWRAVSARLAVPALKDQPGAQTYVLPRPMPGVLPKGHDEKSTLAMDEAIQAAYQWAGQGILNAGYGWLGYAYLAELTQVPEYRRGSEIIAKEMTRKWIRLVGRGRGDKSAKIADLEKAMIHYRVRDRFRRAAELDGFFGRSQLYFDTGASDDAEELQTALPLKKAKVPKDGLKRIGVIEPLWTYPNAYNSSDPLNPAFYNPESWFIQGKLVHASRLLTFVGRELPDILKPAYMFGGLSLTQMARPYVDNWIRVRTSVSNLIHSFSTMVLHTDMSAVQQGRLEGDLISRVDAFNRFRDNRGLMVVNKGGADPDEDLTNVVTPLGTLDHLQAQAQEFLASVQGIPLVVLLGITPSGLNASSEGEIRTFYAWIHAQQEDLFTDPLQKTIEAIQLSTTGDIDHDIGFEFVPLYQLDEAGQSAVRKTQADTDAVYLQEGVLSPEEIRDRLAAERDSPYAAIDLSGPPPAALEEEDFGGEPDVGGDPASGIVNSGARGSTRGANNGIGDQALAAK